jgi:hypothetical protein
MHQTIAEGNVLAALITSPASVTPESASRCLFPFSVQVFLNCSFRQQWHLAMHLPLFAARVVCDVDVLGLEPEYALSKLTGGFMAHSLCICCLTTNC